MAINYQSCLDPSLAQREDHQSYVLAHLAGRTLWHRLYDNLPTIERSIGDRSTDILLRFLKHSERERKSMDWRMYLLFYEWLQQYEPAYATDNITLLECLGAAAARWAGEVIHVGMYRMIVGCRMTGLMAGVARSTAIDQPAKVYQLSLASTIPQGPRFQFSLSPVSGKWCVDRWYPVF